MKWFILIVVLLVVIVGAAVVIVRVAYGPAFEMSGDSMLPLVHDGDFIFCDDDDKDHIKVGDAVVYRHPKSGKPAFKLVVGVGGDKVAMRNGTLIINGTKVQKRPAGVFFVTPKTGEKVAVPQYEETLPNGAKTLSLDSDPKGLLDSTPPRTVPTDSFFVIGSNRDQSIDSRFLSEHGFVPKADVICQVDLPAP